MILVVNGEPPVISGIQTQATAKRWKDLINTSLAGGGFLQLTPSCLHRGHCPLRTSSWDIPMISPYLTQKKVGLLNLCDINCLIEFKCFEWSMSGRHQLCCRAEGETGEQQFLQLAVLRMAQEQSLHVQSWARTGIRFQMLNWIIFSCSQCSQGIGLTWLGWKWLSSGLQLIKKAQGRLIRMLLHYSFVRLDHSLFSPKSFRIMLHMLKTQ